jgi:hypothetical protein
MNQQERAAVRDINWRAIFTGLTTNDNDNHLPNGQVADNNDNDSDNSTLHELNFDALRVNRNENDTEPVANIPDRRPHLYILCSQTNRREGSRQYDIDSFCGHANCLSFARQGIQVNSYPRFQQNISTSTHLYINVTDSVTNPDRPKVQKVAFHKVPHYYFGRVISREDICIYIFFPSMWDPTKKTTFPGRGGGAPFSIL